MRPLRYKSNHSVALYQCKYQISAARRRSVDILAHFVDLAPQVAPLVRCQAANAAAHFGVARGLLHGAALFLGARLVAAGIELAWVGLALFRLARLGLALLLGLGLRTRCLAQRRWMIVAALLAAVAAIGCALGMDGAGAQDAHTSQQATAQQQRRGEPNAKRCACRSVYFFVIVPHDGS
jgi:hypothetical protein